MPAAVAAAVAAETLEPRPLEPQENKMKRNPINTNRNNRIPSAVRTATTGNVRGLPRSLRTRLPSEHPFSDFWDGFIACALGGEC